MKTTQIKYDGSSESGKDAVEFICGMRPETCAGGVLDILNFIVEPGSVITKREWPDRRPAFFIVSE